MPREDRVGFQNEARHKEFRPECHIRKLSVIDGSVLAGSVPYKVKKAEL